MWRSPCRTIGWSSARITRTHPRPVRARRAGARNADLDARPPPRGAVEVECSTDFLHALLHDAHAEAAPPLRGGSFLIEPLAVVGDDEPDAPAAAPEANVQVPRAGVAFHVQHGFVDHVLETAAD